MPNQTIKCPSCQTEISIDDVLTHQIEDSIRTKFEAEQKKKDEEFDLKQKDLDDQKKKIDDARTNVKQFIDQGVAKELEIEKGKLKNTVKEEVEKEMAGEFKMMSDKLEENTKKLDEARQNELELRKAKIQMEEDKKNFELDKQRQLDNEREKIAEEAGKKASEEQQYKIKELAKQLQDAGKMNDDLKRKLQQGSQQTQGEVLELELEELLKHEFPRDEIVAVAKGKNGADVNQIVYDNNGHKCGTIVWESKQAQSWTEGWVAKLKGDQRNIKAEIAVIVTTCLPKDMKKIGQREGIWVTDFDSVVGMATAFRTNLLQLTALKLANIGKDEKTEMLFNYLTGAGFNQRVEAIVESFKSMRNDIQKEKDAYTKIWAKREMQISQVINNTIGMYGDLEGLTGQSMPKIDILELPSGDDEQLEIKM